MKPEEKYRKRHSVGKATTKATTISSLMIADHAELKRLFKEFKKKSNQDFETAYESFKEFKWPLEKHLLVEEKVIFTAYYPKDEEGYALISDLTKQHSRILQLLKKIELQLKRKDKVDFKQLENFKQFENLLMAHKKFEEEALYPKLEKELGESEKEFIVKRLTEK